VRDDFDLQRVPGRLAWLRKSPALGQVLMKRTLKVDEASGFVVFELDDRRFGLHVAAVDRVVHAVEVIPLQDAPETMLGVIDVEGRMVPVVNLRKRFRLPGREIDVDDLFILARTALGNVALPVDRVTGVFKVLPRQVTSSEEPFPGVDNLEGVAMRDDGLVLIRDLEELLSQPGPDGSAAESLAEIMANLPGAEVPHAR